MYIIEILNSKKPCYVAPWSEGDPPRTNKIENAQTFTSITSAEIRIEEIKKTHPFKDMVYDIIENY